MGSLVLSVNGVVPEKFDAVKLSHMVDAEYGNQGLDFKFVAREGFGWTNASFQVGVSFLTFVPTFPSSFSMCPFSFPLIRHRLTRTTGTFFPQRCHATSRLCLHLTRSLFRWPRRVHSAASPRGPRRLPRPNHCRSEGRTSSINERSILLARFPS